MYGTPVKGDPGVALEEPLCRVEINRSDDDRAEFVAKVYSELDGVKELRNTNLELLLRELTIDLEFSFGESVRRGAAAPPQNFEEEGVYPGEEMY